MMNLFLVESVQANASTDVVKRPCSAKILRLISGSSCIVRDGSPAGRIVARLACSAQQVTDTIKCNENEVFTFAVGIYIEMSGNGTFGAYLLNNPVGPQGP